MDDRRIEVAFQRILELAGVEDFDEMIRRWSTEGNEEMQSDNMAGGDNPIDLYQNVQTPSGGELKRTSDEPVDELRNSIPEETSEDDGGEELRVDHVPEGVKRDDISSYYEFESTRSKHVKKFNTTEVDYRLRLKNLDDTFAIDGLSLLSGIMDDVLGGIQPRDMVKIVLQAPGIDKPIA